MIRRTSCLHPRRGSAAAASLCLTLLALADATAPSAAAASPRCDAPAKTEDAGSILLQLRAERGGISDPVQELPTDEATTAKLFCRFDGMLPYWAAIGERFGDYGVACSNDFLCDKMKVQAQEKCGFPIHEAKCVSGVMNKDYKGLMDARNGTELSRDCGYESLGPGKVFAQSCVKSAKYMTAGGCESRCNTWDECTGYMTADRGRECYVVGRVEGDCPGGYSHTKNGYTLADENSGDESFAKIQSCYSRAAAGNFLFFGHSFSCEDFKDYRNKEDTTAAAEAALESMRQAAAQAQQ